ncbi:MAG TPA: DUF305 domain-containing protein [Chloroflexota bacterium]|nr:DUF305 domain-containing protein [Chloroflexota bacterium]
MRRRTIATVAVGATAALAAAAVGGAALAQSVPRYGMMGSPGGGMSGMSGMMGTTGMMGMPGMMGRSGATAQAVEPERWFIEEMIPHHEDAVEMADLALAQAEHAELKALAQQIKTDQTREIAQMRGWYAAWFGVADVPRGTMAQMHESMAPMMAMMARMMGPAMGPGRASMMGSMMGTSAEDTPTVMGRMHADPRALSGAKPFDRAFIEQMVPHHQMAVMMATHALAGATRPELVALLQSIVKTQSAEIAQMQAWYRVWYPA